MLCSDSEADHEIEYCRENESLQDVDRDITDNLSQSVRSRMIETKSPVLLEKRTRIDSGRDFTKGEDSVVQDTEEESTSNSERTGRIVWGLVA